MPAARQDSVDAEPPVNDRLVELGWVRKAHGIRGHVVVRTHNPESDLLVPGLAVLLRKGSDERQVVIKTVALAGRDLKVGFAGFDDRNIAESLRGYAVMVSEETLPAPEPGEFYHRDLIGLEAFSPEGKALGVLERVEESPGHDLYVIRHPDHGEVMVPAVGAFVGEIDMEAGRLVLTNFDGLL